MPITTEKEQAIRSAILDYQAGKYESLTAAAGARNLPVSTVRHRALGRTSRLDTANRNQLLSKEEEEALVLWLKDLQKQRVPVDNSMIRSLVRETLAKKGVEKPVGQNWITRFCRRHPGLQCGKSRSLTKDRARGQNRDKVRSYERTTPDLQPPPTPNSLDRTPQKMADFNADAAVIAAALTPRKRRKLAKMVRFTALADAAQFLASNALQQQRLQVPAQERATRGRNLRMLEGERALGRNDVVERGQELNARPSRGAQARRNR